MSAFRKLKASEIECRIAQVTKDGTLMLLLYKDARVDQKLLDETYGIFGWQRKHEIIGENLYCTVSVKNPETGEWVSKQDVGTESNTEKEKGWASDSFKRACFNFGIGRELYTAPQIWVNKGDYTDNGKGSTYDRFVVTDIGYDEDGNINKLVITNSKINKVVYQLGKKTQPAKKTEKTTPLNPKKAEVQAIAEQKIGQAKVNVLLKQCEDCGINPADVCGKVGVKEITDITEKQFLWIKQNWTKEIVNGVQGAS